MSTPASKQPATTKNNDRNSNASKGNDGDNYDTMSVGDLRQLLFRRGYNGNYDNKRSSQQQSPLDDERSQLVAAARRLDGTDFDQEAHRLFRQLNLEPRQRGRYEIMDPIWKDTSTTTTTTTASGGGAANATVYVGNYQAASDRRALRDRNIVAIVNCQEVTSQNYFEDDSSLDYKRFIVSKLSYQATRFDRERPRRNDNNKSNKSNTDDSAIVCSPLYDGFRDVFDFIQGHLDQGHSVLIHCLAGAHRAGTTGVAWLMYKTGKSVDEALQLAKACRPVISPFGTLLECLYILEEEFKKLRGEMMDDGDDDDVSATRR